MKIVYLGGKLERLVAG